MRIVGISGAQGAGKSTLLNELERRGSYEQDTFKVSRAVQASLGWDSLKRVMDSPSTAMLFQNEVLKQKYENDRRLCLQVFDDHDEEDHEYSSRIILTERTFADVWAYTSMWMWRHHEAKLISFEDVLQYLTEFTAKCAAAQNELYSGVILLPLMRDVVPEDADPNRADRADAETVYNDILSFMNRKSPLLKRLHITTKTIGDRADQVESFLKDL
jgi:hypothetical protein